MNLYLDKSQKNNRENVANAFVQRKSIVKPAFQIEDNRPSTNGQNMIQNKLKQNVAELPIQKKENKTGLPDHLKSGIENLSGYSMDDVKVHYNSERPAQLQAHAFAQGSNIHLASGQEKHLPHEAWHVVQQMQGRVKPTMQMKGNININDDFHLEREADIMGSKAINNEGNSSKNKEKSADASLKNTQLSAFNPIQRLVGFELEYQVPLSSKNGDLTAINGKKSEISAKKRIANYFTGKLKYTHTNILPGKAFDVHVDKINRDFQVANGNLWNFMAVNGLVDDDKWKGQPAVPEYVTPAIDELQIDADKNFNDLFQVTGANMAKVYANSKNSVSDFGAYTTGFPADDILKYGTDNNIDLSEKINVVKSKVKDETRAQATVGIMPSAIFDLHEMLYKSDELTQGKGASKVSDVYAKKALGLALTYTTDVMQSVNNEKIFEDVSDIVFAEIKGLVTIITNYIVGEAYFNSTGFDKNRNVKSGVSLMSRLDHAGNMLDAAPGAKDKLAEKKDRISIIVNSIESHKYYNPINVLKDLGVNFKKQDDDKGHVLTSSGKSFAAGVLKGEDVRGINSGKKITLDNIPQSLAKQRDNQKGVPLEFRRLAVNPGSKNLKSKLDPIIKMVKDANKKPIEKRKKPNIKEEDQPNPSLTGLTLGNIAAVVIAGVFIAGIVKIFSDE